jgi:uncharacterized protein
LISLRFSLLVGLAAVVLLIAAAFGIARIKVDDSLSQLFRSDTPEFKTFEEVTRRFPSNEFDVLIVVEGKSLLERSSIEKLRDLVTDLQLIDAQRASSRYFRPASRHRATNCRRRCFRTSFLKAPSMRN